MLISKTYGSKLTSMHTKTKINGATIPIITISKVEKPSDMMSFSKIFKNSSINLIFYRLNILIQKSLRTITAGRLELKLNK